MSLIVLRGDARHIPLPDASVDLIVTSPPYFGLRSYTDGGEHYAGQIGSEATPAAYIAALVTCTREWVRVLKPSGSLWVNLGDKYSTYEAREPSNRTKPEDALRVERSQERARYVRSAPAVYGVPYKSLMGLPWRYALACTDQLGLILRAEVIWSKPNGLPESVTDRVRRSHEQWFHFTRQPRYYSAVDEIREPHQPQSIARTQRNRFAPDLSQNGVGTPNTLNPGDACNPLGKLPGSVWTIPSQPLTVPPSLGVDHFAAFPMEWPRRIIQGWSPPGICTACGEGRRPVVVGENIPHATRSAESQAFAAKGTAAGRSGFTGDVRWMGERRTTITGYACACPDATAPTRPAVVLDPFGGTGTTALIAHVLGRTGISIDMSADYSRLAAWRTTDPGQRAAAMQVPRPPLEVDGQDELWPA